MDYLKIIGNQKLSGEIYISGAKNAALPLIAATILAKNETGYKNLMRITSIVNIDNPVEPLLTDDILLMYKDFIVIKEI